MNGSALPLAVAEWAPIAILIIVATLMAIGAIVVTHLIGPRRGGAVKSSTYESGMEPVGDTRRRFNVRFYLVAVLFLVFDVEIVFLYPFAVLFPRLTGQAEGAADGWADKMLAAGHGPGFLLVGVGIFFALLTVGFIYEWRKGVFRWD